MRAEQRGRWCNPVLQICIRRSPKVGWSWSWSGVEELPPWVPAKPFGHAGPATAPMSELIRFITEKVVEQQLFREY